MPAELYARSFELVPRSSWMVEDGYAERDAALTMLAALPGRRPLNPSTADSFNDSLATQLNESRSMLLSPCGSAIAMWTGTAMLRAISL